MHAPSSRYEKWLRSVQQSEAAVAEGCGAQFVAVVSGSSDDADYWGRRFRDTSRDVVNGRSDTPVLSFAEQVPAGNLLGTCHMWAALKPRLREASLTNTVGLVSMVVGHGRRLSPFTQCLSGRKAAFPTPRLRNDGAGHLNACELANLSVANVLGALREIGFRGLLVKWGDEALVASNDVVAMLRAGHSGDVIRFGSTTQPDEHSATQKEWLVSRRDNGDVLSELPRQSLRELNAAIGDLNGPDTAVAVNLGSFAISYEVLDAITDAFEEELRGGQQADWDPYFWMAFLACGHQEWSQMKEREAECGRLGIAGAEKRCPGLFSGSQRARAAIEKRLGRPFRSTILDFGEAWWADLGNQRALREHFQSLCSDSDDGRIGRRIYSIPDMRDDNGNIFVRSCCVAQHDIKNSLLVDVTIAGSDCSIRDGVMVGGEYGDVSMPRGGVALFSRVGRLHFDDGAGVIFGYAGDELQVAAGERHCTMRLTDGSVQLTGHELLKVTPQEYCEPILGNAISYSHAASRIAACRIDDWENANRAVGSIALNSSDRTEDADRKDPVGC